MDDVYMLTTLDNPYNPFTQYDEWYEYDTGKGYNTCAYLARITKTSEELSEAEEALAIDVAMDEIVSLNILGNYIKVRADYIPRVVEPKI
jgi:hypothetical protein